MKNGQERFIRCAVLALLAGLGAGSAAAETIYKCRSESGSVGYSATPCRPGSRLEEQRGYEAPAAPAALPQAPATAGRGAVREPADDWPRRPDMEEERQRAAEAAEQARQEAERNKQAETDPRSSLKCIELRRRIGRGGLTLGHVASEGCL
jgi:hypothetical protein